MKSNTPIQETPRGPSNWKIVLRNTASILIALFVFLFALDLMISSLQHLGKSAVETIILATSNPFTGLFIGLLITALIQSSSAVTSMLVALVASGAMTIEAAIPVVMGANVGTTITSIIVSLGFITKKNEFKRAVAAGTYHNFFNILTVVILFPLEYYYGFLSGLSEYLASIFFNQPVGFVKSEFSILGNGFSPVVRYLVDWIDNGFVLAVLSIGLLFSSILFFRKIISNQLGFRSQERFQRFFFRSPFKSFSWGLLTTAAIRSSTITTSLVVPLVAKKVVKLRDAAPFILGANVGTTISAFIAAMFNSNAAISIAISHLLFNLIGVLIFFPVPYLKEIPIRLSKGMGRITLKYRLAGFLYLLLTFFFIPFSLIYFNRDSVLIREMIYEKNDFLRHQKSYYKVIAKTHENKQVSSWMVYDPLEKDQENPSSIFSVYRRKNLLFINNELYELNKPGFCRDSEDKAGKYQWCIKEILPRIKINPALSFDSVFVFEKRFYSAPRDTISILTYISGVENMMVKRELFNQSGRIIASEDLFSLEQK